MTKNEIRFAGIYFLVCTFLGAYNIGYARWGTTADHVLTALFGCFLGFAAGFLVAVVIGVVITMILAVVAPESLVTEDEAK